MGHIKYLRWMPLCGIYYYGAYKKWYTLLFTYIYTPQWCLKNATHNNTLERKTHNSGKVCIYYSLKVSHYQTKTQRLLNQGMPNYGKHIKIRHISLSEAWADKMYIRTRRSISSFLFSFNKSKPSILTNRMFLSGCQPDVFL